MEEMILNLSDTHLFFHDLEVGVSSLTYFFFLAKIVTLMADLRLRPYDINSDVVYGGEGVWTVTSPPKFATFEELKTLP